MGGVGTRIAESVHALPMRVIYHNRGSAGGAGVDRILSEEEIGRVLKALVVSVPLRRETEGLVREAMIRRE